MPKRKRRDSISAHAIDSFKSSALKELQVDDFLWTPDAIRYEDCQWSLREFIENFIPSYRFYTWNLKLIEVLEQVADGDIKRLAVFVPPQFGKTLLAGRIFPAYMVWRFPWRTNAVCSYSSDLGLAASGYSRRVWKETGGINLKDADQLRWWITEEGGGLWASGVGGSSSGKTIDGVGIIDDPVKDFEEARSPTIRVRNENWWESVFEARLSDDAAVVLIQTRWALDDLAGYLLPKEEESFYVLAFSCLYEPEIFVKNPLPEHCTVIPDFRTQPDEPLCPEVRSLERCLSLRRSKPSYIWYSLYQQSPIPIGGGILDMDKAIRYKVAELPKFQRLWLTLDPNFGEETKTGSFNALQLFGAVGVDLYLLQQWKSRKGFVATGKAMLEMIDDALLKYPNVPIESLIEKKAAGPAIIDQLRDAIPNIRGLTKSISKEACYEASAPFIANGHLFIPDEGEQPWVKAYVSELNTVPFAPNDDQADATCQLINELMSIVSARRRSNRNTHLGSQTFVGLEQ